VGFCAIVVLLGMWAYGDIIELTREIPRLRHELTQAVTWAGDYASSRIPALADLLGKTTAVEEQGTARLQDALGSALNATAGMLGEGIQVIFFLILILLEAGRFPGRLQGAFANEQAEHVQARIANINAAIASYLRVKVKANLFLALPAMLVLWLFGIKLVVLWGLLTFFANFVPYLGSVVACALPISFGLLDRGFVWQPMVGAIVLVGVHLTSAYLVEPAMTGKAVDLSPLVVLIALSFWGLCWGLVGMVLAVPLAAVLKIIFENSPSTRPIAKLMGGD
jgi:predicted PurR-regulated permease PerM